MGASYAQAPTDDADRLMLVPCTLGLASEFVDAYHRHLDPPVGGKFAVGVALAGRLVGVAIAGRPVARLLDDGVTIEVTRVATDGARNACSMLYSAIWRAARALGYQRAVTYTLPGEPGTSLRAAGWRCVGLTAGGSWSRPTRERTDGHPTGPKVRWQIEATGAQSVVANDEQASGRRRVQRAQRAARRRGGAHR
jgi:hypothetical protein